MKNNQQKLKEIITETVLEFLNEIDNFQKKIPVSKSMVSKFDVPIKNKPKAGNLIHPALTTQTSHQQLRSMLPPHSHNESNESFTRDIETIPTNTQDAEEPIDDSEKFDGLNATRNKA
jgi:hypothetical protein